MTCSVTNIIQCTGSGDGAGKLEDVDNHDQGRPGTPHPATSLRSRTMEKGMRIVSSELEPGVLLSETWSILLLMPAQPAPSSQVIINKVKEVYEHHG